MSFFFGGAKNSPAKEPATSAAPVPTPRSPVHQAKMDDDPTRFFRKEAIPLVEVDEESKFSVNEGARQILEGLRGKVCVVSIAGLY